MTASAERMSLPAQPVVRQRRLISRRTLRESPRLGISLVLLTLLLLIAVLGPFLAPYNPIETATAQQGQGPSAAHWLGTDDLGRDVFTRTLWGARVSLPVGVLAVAIGLSLGLSLGL